MVRLVAALATVLIGTMLAALPAKAADKVVLMLNWYVYGEHAPFYYGKAKSLYAAEGIDLEIQEGRGSAATTQAVARPLFHAQRGSKRVRDGSTKPGRPNCERTWRGKSSQ